MIIFPYAGLLALVYMVLTVNVITGRYKYRSLFGDEGNFDMQRRIRAHANFIEYTPLFLIIMGYAEIGGFSPDWVRCLCAVFILGRIAHSLSILKIEKYKDGKIQAWPYFRTLGMICMFVPIISASIFLVMQWVKV